jgi:hypothetical protein
MSNDHHPKDQEPGKPAPQTEIDRYERLQIAAEKQIEKVWNAFEQHSSLIKKAVITIAIVAGVFFTSSFWQFNIQLREEMQNSLKIMKGRMDVELESMTNRVEARTADVSKRIEIAIDERFKRDNIDALIEAKVGQKVDKITDKFILESIQAHIDPELQRITNEVASLRGEAQLVRSNLANRLEEFNAQIENAQKKLTNVSTVSDFSLTLLKAKNIDDAVAFRQLKQWASQTDYPLRIPAEQSYQSIVDLDARTPFVHNQNIPFEVISSIKANITNFDGNFNLSMTPDEKIDRINWFTRAPYAEEKEQRKRILTRLMEIYTTDDNLRVVSFVGRIFSREFSPNRVTADHPVLGTPDELAKKFRPLDIGAISREWESSK